MSTSKEYIAFVCDQLAGIPDVTYKKMFGEYMVYVQEKPVLLVCDNCVMVKSCRSWRRCWRTHRRAIPTRVPSSTTSWT